jgi:hypothetical protein
LAASGDRNTVSPAGIVVVPRLGAQQGELVRAGEQGAHTVADQVDRRLVPGEHEHDDHRCRLILTEPLVAVSGDDQIGEQCAPRRGPRRIDQLRMKACISMVAATKASTL